MKNSQSYAEIENFIFSIPRFTKKNTSEQTKLFYERLGRPGENSKLIHVAGTNGKGSVCAYLSSILKEAGYTVGMFTSPHLVSMRERFRIGEELITEEAFVRSYRIVMEEVQRWNNEGCPYHPTFFECLFFVGMVWFTEEKPEYIILETGLGGRLDATNVIDNPLITVITKIALDHTEYLGSTLEEIAGEKAGIIKKNRPVVFWDSNEEVTQVITRKAREMNSEFFGISCRNFRNLFLNNKNIDFSLESKYYRYIRLTLSTCAIYQAENAALAVKALEAMEVGRTITAEQIARAIAGTKWSGRMEEVMPEVFVDGAHNEDGIEAFIKTVEATGSKRNQLLFAVVNDKDYTSMIHILLRDHLFTRIAITKVDGERAVPINQLKEIFEKDTNQELHLYEDAKIAFRDCLVHKGMQDRLYIVGSLYLVGLIKREELL